MSRNLSSCARRSYGLARVCAGCGSRHGRRSTPSAPVGHSPHHSPIPAAAKPAVTGAALLERIRDVRGASPSVGEVSSQGVGARPRRGRPHVEGARAPAHARRPPACADGGRPPPGPAAHDGTILTDPPVGLWGTDATSRLTLRGGTVTIFVTADYRTAACMRIHAANPGSRFEALEPVRQSVRACSACTLPGSPRRSASGTTMAVST